MLKTIASQIKEFKRDSILTPVMMLAEVAVEMVIPLMMASIIDHGVTAGDMGHIRYVGLWMLLMALIGLLTARAVSLYDFPGKPLVRFAGLLPLLIPGTVFAVGIHLALLRLGLADTLAGVLLVHVMTALPYSIAILTDVTAALGGGLEEQAAVLGAGPVRGFFAVSLPELTPGILSSMSMAFILSYSQYFTTLIVGGGRVRTLALALVPYIQGGDRSLASVYALAFTGSALGVFALFETLIRRWQKRGDRP